MIKENVTMKKFIAMLLTTAALFGTGAAIAADNEPTVYLNGEQMTFDVNPFIEDGRTLVPMRAIFEAVGASVTWDEEDRTVHAIREKDGEVSLVSLQIDSAAAFVNSGAKELDVPAKIVDDRTFVPLRFVIESLGERVEWDADNYAVKITTAQ